MANESSRNAMRSKAPMASAISAAITPYWPAPRISRLFGECTYRNLGVTTAKSGGEVAEREADAPLSATLPSICRGMYSCYKAIRLTSIVILELYSHADF